MVHGGFSCYPQPWRLISTEILEVTVIIRQYHAILAYLDCCCFVFQFFYVCFTLIWELQLSIILYITPMHLPDQTNCLKGRENPKGFCQLTQNFWSNKFIKYYIIALDFGWNSWLVTLLLSLHSPTHLATVTTGIHNTSIARNKKIR